MSRNKHYFKHYFNRFIDRVTEAVTIFFIFAIPITFACGYTYLRIQQYNLCNEGKMGACIAFYGH